MEIKKKIAKRDNYGESRSLSDIKYLVYHYTGNKTDTAKNNATYFSNNSVGASAHYFVDSNDIYQSVPDYFVAYAVGSKGLLDQGYKYKSKGAKFWKKCTNQNSISIEMCSENSKHTDKTITNAIALGNMLMRKYNIPEDRVIRHFDVNGKMCPLTLLGDKEWANFKTRLSKAGEEKVSSPIIKFKGDLTEHFSIKDYTVGLKTGTVYVTKESMLHATMLEEFIVWLKRPMNVTSWYRTVAKNNEVGGVPSSSHLKGCGTDFHTNITIDNTKFVKYAKKWKKICNAHGVVGEAGLYSWGMHLGSQITYSKTFYNWDIRSGKQKDMAFKI